MRKHAGAAAHAMTRHVPHATAPSPHTHRGVVILQLHLVPQLARVVADLVGDGLALCVRARGQRMLGACRWDACGQVCGAHAARHASSSVRRQPRGCSLSSVPLALAPTFQRLPHDALALILRTLLALEALAVQVLLAQAHIAAQHGAAARCTTPLLLLLLLQGRGP